MCAQNTPVVVRHHRKTEQMLTSDNINFEHLKIVGGRYVTCYSLYYQCAAGAVISQLTDALGFQTALGSFFLHNYKFL